MNDAILKLVVDMCWLTDLETESIKSNMMNKNCKQPAGTLLKKLLSHLLEKYSSSKMGEDTISFGRGAPAE